MCFSFLATAGGDSFPDTSRRTETSINSWNDRKTTMNSINSHAMQTKMSFGYYVVLITLHSPDLDTHAVFDLQDPTSSFIVIHKMDQHGNSTYSKYFMVQVRGYGAAPDNDLSKKL